MPTDSAPTEDGHDELLWTHGELLVHSGVTDRSASYEPCANRWRTIATPGVERYASGIPAAGGVLYFESVPRFDRVRHWMSRLTWFDLEQAIARELPADVPGNRKRAAVWTGSQLLWWGGALEHAELSGPQRWEDRDDGASYDFARGSWRALSRVGAPVGRMCEGAAVWTGSRLVVWGGRSAVAASTVSDPERCFNRSDAICRRFGDGAIYDPERDRWQAMSTSGAPAARSEHLLVWVGSAVLVLGGSSYTSTGDYLPFANAYRYTIEEDRWSEVALPQPLLDALADSLQAWDKHHVWTGTHLLVSMGTSPTYAYDPREDRWDLVPPPPDAAVCPAGTHQGVCSEASGRRFFGSYDPASKRWTMLDYPVRDLSLSRTHTVYTGTQLIEWGGDKQVPQPTPLPCPMGMLDCFGPANSQPSNAGGLFTPQR